MIALKIVKVDKFAWKNRFCWRCKGCQVSCRLFSFPPISSQMEWCHINTAWLLPINARQFQNMVATKVASFTNFFRIAGWVQKQKLCRVEKLKVYSCRWRQKSIKFFEVTLIFPLKNNSSNPRFYWKGALHVCSIKQNWMLHSGNSWICPNSIYLP